MSEETAGQKFTRLTATEDLVREWQQCLEERRAVPVVLIGIIEGGPNVGDPVVASNITRPELLARFLESCVKAMRDPDKLVHEVK